MSLLRRRILVSERLESNAFSVIYNTNLSGSSTTFNFYTRFKGDFDIDWGDGNISHILSDNTYSTLRSHTYVASKNDYIVSIINTGITDMAASNGSTTAIISFYNQKGVRAIGKPNGENASISALLTPSWKTGEGVNRGHMFNQIFLYSGLTNIPTDLFSGITGVPANNMFLNTFRGCANLAVPIPPQLFSGIVGPGKNALFYATFQDSPITGSIPAQLFQNISPPTVSTDYPYSFTFFNCSSIQRIEDAFANITFTQGSSRLQVNGMFYLSNPSSIITGSTPKTADGKELWDVLTSGSSTYTTFHNLEGLSNYGNIPSGWK